MARKRSRVNVIHRLINRPNAGVALAFLSILTTFFAVRAINPSFAGQASIPSTAYYYLNKGCRQGVKCADMQVPNYEWCAFFVSWVYAKSGVPLYNYRTKFNWGTQSWQWNSVAGLRDGFFKPRGEFYAINSTNLSNRSPRKGDVLFNDSGGSHVSMVYDVRNSGSSLEVRSIGGNESNAVKLSGWFRLAGSGYDNYGRMDRWKQLNGRASAIGAGPGGVWVIGGDSYAYKQLAGLETITPSNSQWQKRGGGGVFDLDVASSDLWKLASDTLNIYRMPNSGGSAQPMNGKARDVGIHGNDVWVIGGNRCPYQWNGSTSSSSRFSQRAGSCDGVKIDNGPGGPWRTTTNDGAIQRWTGSGWSSVAGGKANDIGRGTEGSSWVVGRGSAGGGYRVYYYFAPINNWRESDGAGTDITVDTAGRPWLVNNNGNIFAY